MESQATLLHKDEETAQTILTRPERTLPAVIFSSTGEILCKITRRKKVLPWYFNLVLLAIVIQLPTLIVANVLNEREQWSKLGLIWMGYIELGLSASLIARVGIFYLYRNINEHILDKFQTEDKVKREIDLEDLERVLARAWSFRSALYFTIGFTIFWCISFTLVSSLYIKHFIGFGLLVGTIVFGLLTGPALFIEGWFFIFILHIGTYSYELNETSPAHSEVVWRLSKILTRLLYSFAVFIAFATAAVAFNAGAVLLVIVIGWIPTTVYFIGTQMSIGKIITTAKWKTLNRIQEEISRLHNCSITEKENIDAINRLMDYHARIRATPDSTFNFGTGLSFVNQLALPLVGLLLANLDKLRQILFP